MLVRLPYINCNWILQPGQYWCVLTLKSWIPVGSVMVPFFLVMFSHQQWNLRTAFSPPCPLSPPPISCCSLAHEFRQHQGCRCCGLLLSTPCMQRSLGRPSASCITSEMLVACCSQWPKGACGRQRSKPMMIFLIISRLPKDVFYGHKCLYRSHGHPPAGLAEAIM